MSHHDHHHHHHDEASEMSFDEKLVKLLEHWIKHDADHAASYRDWAEKAKAAGLAEAGAPLLDAAEMTLEISTKFQEAIDIIKKSRR